MLVVSLTGGIASGKSTASRLFSGAPHHIPLIDLDLLARQVVEPNDKSHTLDKLVAHFGRDAILQADGTLNRPALGRLTFGKENEANRKVLNRITHTAIRKRMAWLLFQYWMNGTAIVIIDTPLAIEAGLWKFCGELILVQCTPEEQLRRMVKRDAERGLTEEDAKNRLSSQLPLADKVPYSDTVLDNSDAAKETLEQQVERVVRRWTRERKQGWGRVRTVVQWIGWPVGAVMAVLAIFARQRRVARRVKQHKQEQRAQ